MTKKIANSAQGQLGSQLVVERINQSEEPKKYRVVMLNDDFTPMDFVTDVLMSYFNKTEDQAVAIMLAIHNEGRGIAGIYSLEIAKEKLKQVNLLAQQENYPLSCELEREK